jgi:class 3 adenylate cyclase
MGRHEEETLERLMAHRRTLVDPKIAEHHGRIVKTTGDGMLVEFVSVVDAVRCAVEIERGMAERNSGVPIVRDATARPRHPVRGDGYQAAMVNYQFLARAVLSTDEAVDRMR